MKVKLDKEYMMECMYSEEQLLELSIAESFYVIRKLKALLALGESVFEPVEVNSHNQCYLPEFKIWCHYILVEE